MTVRADHVAGGAFVVFGALVFALSGDLPMGTLSFPTSGFLPKLVACLLIVFGVTLFLRAGESKPFAELEWTDLKHAGLVLLITGIAVAAYIRLGFIITMTLLVLGLLVIVERRNVVRATLYSLVVALLAYGVFDRLIKAPLPPGPFGF